MRELLSAIVLIAGAASAWKLAPAPVERSRSLLCLCLAVLAILMNGLGAYKTKEFALETIRRVEAIESAISNQNNRR